MELGERGKSGCVTGGLSWLGWLFMGELAGVYLLLGAGGEKSSASLGPIVEKYLLIWSGIVLDSMGLLKLSFNLIVGLVAFRFIRAFSSRQNFLGSSE